MPESITLWFEAGDPAAAAYARASPPGSFLAGRDGALEDEAATTCCKGRPLYRV